MKEIGDRVQWIGGLGYPNLLGEIIEIRDNSACRIKVRWDIGLMSSWIQDNMVLEEEK